MEIIDFSTNSEIEFAYGDVNSDNRCTNLYYIDVVSGSLPIGVTPFKIPSYRPRLIALPGAWLNEDREITLKIIQVNRRYQYEIIQQSGNDFGVPIFDMEIIDVEDVATATFLLKAFDIIQASSVYDTTYETGIVPKKYLSAKTRYVGNEQQIQYFYENEYSTWSSEVSTFSPEITTTYLKSYSRRGIVPRYLYFNGTTVNNYWYEVACDNVYYFQWYYIKANGYYIRGKRKPLESIDDEQLWGDWEALPLSTYIGEGISHFTLLNEYHNLWVIRITLETFEGIFESYADWGVDLISVEAVKGGVYIDKELISFRADIGDTDVEFMLTASDGMVQFTHVINISGFIGTANYFATATDRSNPNYEIVWKAIQGSYNSKFYFDYAAATSIELNCPFGDVITTSWYIFSGEDLTTSPVVGDVAYLTAVDGEVSGLLFEVLIVEKGSPTGQGIVIKKPGAVQHVLADSERGMSNFIDWVDAPADTEVSKVLAIPSGVTSINYSLSILGEAPDYIAAELHTVTFDSSTNTITLSPHPQTSYATRVILTGS